MEEDLLQLEAKISSNRTTSSSSTGDGDPALSVISDSLSEQEYSSDSGKGGSGSDTLTPPDSVNDTETIATQWHLCPAYSSYTSYSKSLGRILPGHAMIYEFEISQSIVGRLIGRYGCFVNKIKVTTGANIIVKRHFLSGGLKICAVEGICSEIDQAICMIRDRFPIKRFPNLTLVQVNPGDQIPPSISFLPSNNKLNLIEGVVNDVSVSCVVSLDHIFVQQPTHPTFPALSRLHQALKSLYEQPVGAPKLSRPFNTGVICVAQIKEDEWLRSEVVAVDEEKDQVTTRLVDVGGYVHCPIDALRQIRVDFVTIPFQSTECRLANVTPINEEDGWSEEALNFFKILCQGQVLQANVVGYSTKDSITLIHLYKLNENHSHLFINEELVNHGYAKWIDEAEYYTPQDEIRALCQKFDDSADLSSGIASPIEPEFSTPSWGDSSSSDELAVQEGTHDTEESSAEDDSLMTEKEPTQNSKN